MTNNVQTEEHTATGHLVVVESGDRKEVTEPRPQHGCCASIQSLPCGYNKRRRRPSTLQFAVFLAVIAVTAVGVIIAVMLTYNNKGEQEVNIHIPTGSESSCSVIFRNDSVIAKPVEYQLDEYVEDYDLDDDDDTEGGDCRAYYGPIVVQKECTAEEKSTLPPSCLTVYYNDYCGIHAGVCSNAGMCNEERGLVSLIDRNMGGVRAECSSTDDGDDMTLHVDNTYDARAPVHIHEMNAVLAFDASGDLGYHIGMLNNDARNSGFTVLGEVRVVLKVNDDCDEWASWDCADAAKFSEAIDDGRLWELPCAYVWAREDAGTIDQAKVLSELCGSGRRRLN